MPDMPTGQLIRLYRIDRKKSTTSVATHVGITVRYLEMIEAGTKTPSLPVLRKLAKVLGVRTSALIGGEAPSEDHEGPVNPRLADVERALYTYRSVSLSNRGDTPLELSDLAQRIKSAWDTWLVSPNKYTDTLSVLPGLIVDAPEAGAQCVSSARWDLRGGPPARAVPTAINCELSSPAVAMGCVDGFSDRKALR